MTEIDSQGMPAYARKTRDIDLPALFSVVDIETVPSAEEGLYEAIRASVRPPPQYKKPESIEKWMDANAEAVAEEKYRKLSLHWTHGEICALGWRHSCSSRTRSVVRGQKRDNETEKGMLLRFFREWVNQLGAPGDATYRMPVLVGHNLEGFDLPYIWHRCQVNNVRPPMQFPHMDDGRLWLRDTMIMWCGRYAKGDQRYISMHELASVLGIKLTIPKEEVDGSKVLDLFINGEIEKIGEYVRSDVDGEYEIFQQLCLANAVSCIKKEKATV